MTEGTLSLEFEILIIFFFILIQIFLKQAEGTIKIIFFIATFRYVTNRLKNTWSA
jgi:hypothetical protein